MPEGNLTYKRGEIRWVNLNPVVGRETSKKRPCLILQNDLGNKFAPTTIIAPFMPTMKDYPFLVNVKKSKMNGLDCDRQLNLSQIRAVDCSRVENLQGILEKKYWNQIEKAINVQLGFSNLFS
jgi:mRNA interferase MazF